MIEICSVDGDQYTPTIRAIFWEFLQWANERIGVEYGISFDIAAILEGDMQALRKFMPPSGRLLLGLVDHQLAGIVCLERLREGCGVIKRMYVRPAYRRIGLGRALLARLLSEAVQIGYQRIYLDSAGFMTDAHHLYRSSGFVEIEPYAGSDIPAEYQRHWVFMQKDIAPVNNLAPTPLK
jgi:GNAT superfamily N-acetyltransferase